MMVNHLVIKKMMPLMARENELFGREALALCNVLLFNANSNAQVRFNVAVTQYAFNSCVAPLLV